MTRPLRRCPQKGLNVTDTVAVLPDAQGDRQCAVVQEDGVILAIPSTHRDARRHIAFGYGPHLCPEPHRPARSSTSAAPIRPHSFMSVLASTGGHGARTGE